MRGKEKSLPGYVREEITVATSRSLVLHRKILELLVWLVALAWRCGIKARVVGAVACSVAYCVAKRAVGGCGGAVWVEGMEW